MKFDPLISVIIANYNNGNYIGDCLDSVLNQTYKDIEIIIADDCSTDNSQEIVKEYEKKYPGVIKCIFSPINRGVARTRHEAILQAKGEYITTLDSDDYYYNPEKLEKEMGLVFYFKEKKSRDIIAFSNIVLVKEDKTVIGKQDNTETIKEGIILDEIITRSCMIPRDFVMRKTAYHEIAGYDLSIPIYEDWDLKTRLSAKYEFYYCGISGTAYRRHGEGLSSVSIPIHIKWLKKIFKKNIKLVDQYKKKGIIQAFNQFVKSMRKHYFNNCLKKELELNLDQRAKGNGLKLYFKVIYHALNQFKFKCLLRLFSRNKKL